jgi:hypothetical protein
MMPNFVIPGQLQETLNEDRALAWLVNTAISEFGIWLERNNVKSKKVRKIRTMLTNSKKNSET